MLASALYGAAHVVNIILNLATLIVVLSVGISWFQADPRNPYVRMVRSMTEPIYRPIRRWTAKITGPFDLAPLVLMLVIVFLEKAVPTYLMSLYWQMK
ncbi:MAG: YggT family protein [Oligoflexales bacterium]|nr:YggT family protein [Oligoflexales bacterium]